MTAYKTELLNKTGLLNWHEIDTVLLDMDGTLLDLHYDNHFWQVYVPAKFAEQHGLPHAEAHAECFRRYDAKVGTLDWYCVDYWTEQLQLDIVQLKRELAHLIAVHPDVPEFLQALQAAGKRSVLVTNAHRKSLDMKMDRTGLAIHFDAMHVSHEYGIAKEDPDFWAALQDNEPFERKRTLLVDDSLPVLRSAREFGIANLLAILQPDTQQPDKAVADFAAIRRFGEIMPPLYLK
jgi:putative hydrolase of the HAD superfamily